MLSWHLQFLVQPPTATLNTANRTFKLRVHFLVRENVLGPQHDVQLLTALVPPDYSSGSPGPKAQQKRHRIVTCRYYPQSPSFGIIDAAEPLFSGGGFPKFTRRTHTHAAQIFTRSTFNYFLVDFYLVLNLCFCIYFVFVRGAWRAMATSFGAATATAASVAENARKSSPYLPLCRRHFYHSASKDKVSFCFSAKPKLRLSSKGLWSGWNCSTMVRAQLNEVAVDESSKGASSNPVEAKDVKSSKEAPPSSLASEESISEFMNQVSNLVKLVASKDIVELQLKQLDCELLIRKKEALAPPPSAPITYIQSLPQPSVPPPVPAAASSSPPPTPAPVSAPAPATATAPTPPKVQPSKSSHPPLKSPMAGTLYRSPAPGEPPFVQVGSKVKKGQILCIIEAMKLMNEIEADQAGTIVEILAEDGKPVSVDTPLFVIEP